MTAQPGPPNPPPALPATGEGTNSAPAAPAGAAQQTVPAASFPEAGAATTRGRDAPFFLFVCALAFLLASTPARNSDLWLHLASGRLLAQGRFPGRTDPFASTTTGAFWVNHAWLSDALLYGLHQLSEGQGLVFAKALLVTVLAGLFFCFRRPRTGVGTVGLAATVAVLALGPWLLLQPALLSLLGALLTLYLLERPALVEGQPAQQRAERARWLLVPLFALWANLDAWVFLGPLLVALYALGELLRRLFQGPRTGRAGERSELTTLTLLSLAGLAACLLTPYHYHALAWPSRLGLSHTEQALMRDPIGQGLVFSPFGAGFRASPVFASPGAWAYYLLLAGGASFAVCGRAIHPGRLLAWLALAALSIYQARAIPFFAVVAGPILALNCQEWAGAAPRSAWLQRLGAARGIAALAGLALLVLAWPGWLQPAPYEPRAWTIEPDGSLVRLARQLEKWHAQQRFRPDRFPLTFSPEAAHHLAWFCPAEKGLVDSRWPLFDAVADDYVQMRRCLLQANAGPDRELAPLLRAHHIDRIILHDPTWERTSQAYRCLLLDGEEWDLLALEGTAALFGRRSRARSPSAWAPIDLRRAAYHPEEDRRAPAAPRPPQPPGPFDPFYRAPIDRSPERGEAAMYLMYFDVMAERRRSELRRQGLPVLATGLVGAGPGSRPAGVASAVVVRLHLWAAALADAGPPEALLLAVRAARRALAANPDDGGASLLLGEAYLRLSHQTREQSWRGALPVLAAIRQAQALTALEHAVSSRPELDQPHALLAQIYYETGQMDRALDHLRARLRIAHQQIKRRGAEAQSASERRPALEADVDKMERLVRRSQDIYKANTEEKAHPSKVAERAGLAARHGLSRLALEMLLESQLAIFGKSGAKMQLDLMLLAGRAAEVRAWLGPEHEAVLGFAPCHWLLAQAAAACGDYAGADAELDQLSQELRLVRVSADKLLPVRSTVALRVGEAALTCPVIGSGPPGLASAAYLEFRALRPLDGPAGLLRQEADFRVLRGLLALEAGAVETAQEHFRAAVGVWGSNARAARGAGLDFPTRPIAQHALGLLETGGARER